MSAPDPIEGTVLSNPSIAAAVAKTSSASALIPPPTERAKFRVIATMVLARFGIMVAYTTPLVAGLVLKLLSLVGPANVVIYLGTITSIGALMSLLFDPVFGRLSDRTTSRWGRRRPWLVAGSIGLVIGMTIMGLAPNPWVVGIGWMIAQGLGNAAVAAHTATIADQLPSSQRGKVAGAIGVAQQAANIGAAYAAALLGSVMLLLFLIPGLFALATMVLFAFVLPDKVLPHKPASEGGIMTVLKTFWVNPIKHPDFALTWASRFLLVLANFMFTTFRLLWIQHEYGLTPAKAAQILATGVLVYTISLIVAGQLAGWLSDVVKRRKPFILLSALIFGVGVYFLVHATTPSAFFVAEGIMGVGFGIYVALRSCPHHRRPSEP
jgi:MFS family permease